MTVSIKAPNYPESIEEGTLSTWHKKQGDSVQKNEKVADIETDKIVLEVNAPEAGVLKSQKKKEGDSVAGEEVIGEIDTSGDGGKDKDTGDKESSDDSGEEKEEKKEKKKPAGDKEEEDEEQKGDGEEEEEPEEEKDEDGEEKEQADEEDDAGDDESGDKDKQGERPEKQASSSKREAEKRVKQDPNLGPAVRKLIVEHELNPDEIAGTGRSGRITKADVIRHLEHSPHLTTKYGDASVESQKIDELVPPPQEEAAAQTSEKRVKMSRLRARIAERLVEAQQTAALLTTFNEVDMKAVMELRARHKEAFQKEHGVKLGFMSFFVKATVEALKQFPVVNATVEEDEIVYYGNYHIGVAVSSDRGLVVPVIRNAEQLSLANIEKGINDFAERAQAGALDIEELTGGTFTISNGGVFGSMMSTPIVNPPQSAILGMHRIQERPVAVNGEIVIRPMMYLALTYDHRIIDGREAVQFLVHLKQNIEDPARLLLQL